MVQAVIIELMCSAKLEYYVRLWNQPIPAGYIDIPVKSKNEGILLIAKIINENEGVTIL